MYLFLSFPFLFIVMLTLIGNESLHLCATANVLQTGVLMCIAPLLPLLLLLFGINARNECVTNIWLCQCYNDDLGIFSTHHMIIDKNT